MNSNYTIRLDGIYVRAFHGCYDLEQQVGNRFRVDLAITTPLGTLPETDDVRQAVNYLTVFEIVDRGGSEEYHRGGKGGISPD